MSRLKYLNYCNLKPTFLRGDIVPIIPLFFKASFFSLVTLSYFGHL